MSVTKQRPNPAAVPEIVMACYALGIRPDQVRAGMRGSVSYRLPRLAFWAAWCEGARIGKSRASIGRACGIYVQTVKEWMRGMPKPDEAGGIAAARRLFAVMRAHADGKPCKPLTREEIIGVMRAIERRSGR